MIPDSGLLFGGHPVSLAFTFSYWRVCPFVPVLSHSRRIWRRWRSRARRYSSSEDRSVTEHNDLHSSRTA